MTTLRVVIVYRTAALLPRAYRWCATHGWTVDSAVPKGRFSDAVRLVSERRADIIVAASADSLDPDRVPRVEVVPDDDT